MALNYKRIGERIRTIRKARHYSQSQLAELIDRSVPYISHIETGRKHVSLDVLSRIADALEVPINVLTGDNPKLQHQTNVFELNALLEDCTLDEQQMLIELTYAAKEILIRYRSLIGHDGES